MRSFRRCLPFLLLLFCTAVALAPCSAPPDEEDLPQQPAPAAVSERHIVLFTGADRGILEPCGCTKGMLGGIGRRAFLIEALHTGVENGSILTVAAGGLCGGTTALDILRYETLLMALGEIGYDAAALGPEELSLGLDRLRDAAEIAGFPFLLSNVSFPGETELPFRKRLALKDRGSLAFNIFGVIAPSLRSSLPKEASYLLPEEAIAIADDSSGSAMTLVLMRGNREEARDLREKIAGPCLVIYAAFDSEPQVLDFGLKEGDVSVVTPGDRGRFVGLASLLYEGPERGAVVTKVRPEPLDPTLPESETVLFAEEIYRNRIEIEGLMAKMVERKDHPTGAAFMGSESCRECHPKTHEIWAASAHAHALKTLVEARRDYDPGCLSCHVTGFGYRGAFRSVDETPHLVNVGCESCHGPAGDHGVDEEAYPGKVIDCTACHDHYHSPGFDRESAWKRIMCIKEE